jgi:hypothetical protein
MANFQHWYLGYSYGARWFVDIVPLIFMIFLILIKDGIGNIQRNILMLCFGLAFIINTVQGLYNNYTLAWNAHPNVDHFNSILWDWKYPQFLANRYGHKERIRQFGIMERGIFSKGWTYSEKKYIKKGKTAGIRIECEIAKHLESLLLVSQTNNPKLHITINGTSTYWEKHDHFRGHDNVLIKLPDDVCRNLEQIG